MMNRSLTALLLIISALFLITAGCSKAPAITGSEVVRVQAPAAPPSIPLISIMQEKNVEVTWYQKTEEAMSRIIEDKVDISIIPVNSMAILYNKGVDLQLGAVCTWGILHMVSGDPQVKGWNDLKGKTIAVGAMGFSPDLVFRTLLAKHGLKAGEDLNLVYGTSPEIAQMLIAKKLTLAVLPEPLVTSVLLKNKELKTVLNLEREWEIAFPASHGLPQAGLAVSKRFISQNPAAWQLFYQRYNESLIAYMNHPEKIGAEEEKIFNLPAAVIRESLGRSNLKLQGALEARDPVNRYLEEIYKVYPDAVGGRLPDFEGDFYLK
ncbi:MAG: ABC transporter substrate-binding protein [Desulfocucumaceae bacterium]